MKLPDVINCQLNEKSVELTINLSPSLFWFKGHFPQQAILPGVTQLNWVLHYARHYLAINNQFKGIDVMKFQCPLFPGQTVKLIIDWHSETNKLSFQYLVADKQITSSGRIVLCPSQH